MRIAITAAALLLLLAACTSTTGGTAALDRTSWRLIEIDGRTPVAGADVTLQFGGGNAEGFASCNQYRAPYTVSGSSLSFGPAISTKRACIEDDRNAQETAYLGALANVASFAVLDDRLTLSNAAGAPLLTFSRGR